MCALVFNAKHCWPMYFRYDKIHYRKANFYFDNIIKINIIHYLFNKPEICGCRWLNLIELKLKRYQSTKKKIVSSSFVVLCTYHHKNHVNMESINQTIKKIDQCINCYKRTECLIDIFVFRMMILLPFTLVRYQFSPTG